MTRVKGMIEFEGAMDGYCFYRINGKRVVRRIGTVSQKHREEAPSYARVRASMQEFAGASVIGAGLRHALGPFAKEMSDSYAYGRLNAELKKLLAMGEGEPGKRRFHATVHGSLLNGFEFNARCALHDLVKAPVVVRCDRSDGSAVAELPALNLATLSHAPQGATHAAWVLCMVTLSSYAYDEERKAYRPATHVDPIHGVRAQSPIAALSEGLPPILLKAHREDGPALPVGCALVVCVGVRFFRIEYGVPVSMKREGALKVVEVV